MELIKIYELTVTDISISYNVQFNNLQLKKSIKKYGQLRPIIINNNNEIIDGMKIFKILKELDIEDIWVKKIDTDKKEQIHCELNIDNKKINCICFFSYLRQYIDLNNNCLPFTKKELNNFVDLLDFDWDSFKSVKTKSLF